MVNANRHDIARIRYAILAVKVSDSNDRLTAKYFERFKYGLSEGQGGKDEQQTGKVVLVGARIFDETSIT